MEFFLLFLFFFHFTAQHGEPCDESHSLKGQDKEQQFLDPGHVDDRGLQQQEGDNQGKSNKGEDRKQQLVGPRHVCT
jgi:hypothetical protein